MASQSKKKNKLCKISEEAFKLDDSDGISRLPEAILQHIFFFLPVEDAVPLSTVSKSWLKAWNSLPVLEFRFDHDQDGTLKELATSIDASLSTLTDRRAVIKSFSLKINPSQEEGLDLDSHLDNWLSLVMKNYVKEINVRVANSDNISCTLPQAIFTSKSLVKLQLKGCKFPAKISFADDDKKFRLNKFNSLKEISLVNIVAHDDQIQELINFSRHFLEKLTIKTSPSVKVLKLDHFLKLSYVEANVKTFHVNQATNLDTVVLYGLWRVDAYGCGNIRTLRCLTWDANAYKSIQALISNLPLLETLQLFLSHHQKIKIQSRLLRTLLLFEGQRFEKPMEVELDTPQLTRLYFSGLSIPFVTMLSRNQKLELHHFGHPSGGIDGSHLHKLGKFSQNFIHPIVEIHLHQIFTENLLTLEQLKEHPVVYHPLNVRMLALECIPASSDYTSFLNALFWSCHPNALVVLMATEETLYSDHRDTFIKFLCDELLDREENPKCCTENKSKCWRHYIADVKFFVYRSLHDFEKPVDLPHQVAENGISTIDTKNKGVVVEFRFLWLPYPVLPGNC